METQQILNSQSNLKKKEWNWKNQPFWLQTILQSYSHLTVWHWHKNRNIDQWNKIENPELNPHTYGHPIFDKGGTNIQWRKDTSINGVGKTGQLCVCKRMKWEHFLIAYTKVNSKWIKDLNGRPETIKFLKENIGRLCWQSVCLANTLWHKSQQDALWLIS